MVVDGEKQDGVHPSPALFIRTRRRNFAILRAASDDL